MFNILEDYKAIYKNDAIGKLQRKQQYQEVNTWLKTEYKELPDLYEVLTFCKDNQNIKFNKQFYDKLIFPQINLNNKEYDVDALLFVFQNEIIDEYMEYLSWEVSILELENKVFDKYPENIVVLKYRYNRLNWWFNYSIHELPSGVLNGNNGATLLDIRGMKEDLLKFKELCAKLNIKNEEQIIYISSIYNAYEDYLSNKVLYSDFRSYLNEHKIKY